MLRQAHEIPSLLINQTIIDKPDELLAKKNYVDALVELNSQTIRYEQVDDYMNAFYESKVYAPIQIPVTERNYTHSKHYFQRACLYFYGLGCEEDTNKAYQEFISAISSDRKEVLQAILDQLQKDELSLHWKFVGVIAIANAKLGNTDLAKKQFASIYEKILTDKDAWELKYAYFSFLGEIKDIEQLKKLSLNEEHAFNELVRIAESTKDVDIALTVAEIVSQCIKDYKIELGIKYLNFAVQAKYPPAIQFALQAGVVAIDPSVQLELAAYYLSKQEMSSALYHATRAARQGSRDAYDFLKTLAMQSDEARVELASVYLQAGRFDHAASYSFEQFFGRNQIDEDNETLKTRLTLFKNDAIRTRITRHSYEDFVHNCFIPAMENDLELIKLLPTLFDELEKSGNTPVKKKLEEHLHELIIYCVKHPKTKTELLCEIAQFNTEAKFYAGLALCQSGDQIALAKQYLRAAANDTKPHYLANLLLRSNYSESELQAFNEKWSEAKKILLPSKQLLHFIANSEGYLVKLKPAFFQQGDLLTKVKDLLEKGTVTNLLELAIAVEQMPSASASKFSEKILGFMLHQLFEQALLNKELTNDVKLGFPKNQHR